ALDGAGYFDWHLPPADESLVVEGDRPQAPGGLDGLRRLHVKRDRAVALLLDLAGRVLDRFRQRRQVGSVPVLPDALDARAGDARGRPGPGGTSEARDDEHDIRRERSPKGAFLVLGGSARRGDTVLVLAVREEDLYIALRLRQPRGVRVHSDRLDALDIAIVERAHHLAAGSADADHRDLRVHGVLEQAADDLVHKVLGYHRFRPPISSVDLSKEAGRPFARGEECIPSLLSGSHSFFPSLPCRLLPSGVRHPRALHGGMSPYFSPVETATPLRV